MSSIVTKSGSRKRARNDGRSRVMRHRIPMDTLARSGGFKVIKKVTSTGGITVVPTSGLNITALTASPVIALYFTLAGYTIYDPTVGTSPSSSYAWTGSNSYYNIFDQYRINSVTVKGYFSNNTSTVASVVNNIPLFYTAIDYDGGAILVNSLNGVLSYSNSQIHQANSSGKPCFYRKFQPRTVNNLSGNLVTSNQYGINKANQWIDTASPNCPHWGLMLAYDNQGATQTSTEGSLTIIAEIEYEFKGIRA